MNGMEIVLVALAAAAGVLAVTYATITSLVRAAIRKHDDELFDAYVHSRHELETWLVRGALTHIQRALPAEEPRD